MCVILHLSTERLQTVVSSHLAMYLCTVKDTPTSVVRIVIVYCRCLNTQQPSPNNDLSIATNEQNLLFCTPFFSMARQPLGGLGRHIFRGFTITHFFLDTAHSVELLWTSDQPVAETSTLQHTSVTRDRHPCPRWDSNQQSQ